MNDYIARLYIEKNDIAIKSNRLLFPASEPTILELSVATIFLLMKFENNI